jgi:hypothetical protein
MDQCSVCHVSLGADQRVEKSFLMEVSPLVLCRTLFAGCKAKGTEAGRTLSPAIGPRTWLFLHPGLGAMQGIAIGMLLTASDKEECRKGAVSIQSAL